MHSSQVEKFVNDGEIHFIKGKHSIKNYQASETSHLILPDLKTVDFPEMKGDNVHRDDWKFYGEQENGTIVKESNIVGSGKITSKFHKYKDVQIVNSFEVEGKICVEVDQIPEMHPKTNSPIIFSMRVDGFENQGDILKPQYGFKLDLKGQDFTNKGAIVYQDLIIENCRTFQNKGSIETVSGYPLEITAENILNECNPTIKECHTPKNSRAELFC